MDKILEDIRELTKQIEGNGKSSRVFMEEVAKELMELYAGRVPSELHVLRVKEIVAKIVKALSLLER